LSSVVIRSIDRERINRAVADHVAHLCRQHPEIERAIWFGSWVNGEPTPGSDVDLCLVLSSSEKSRRERFVDYLPVGFPVGVDLFAYTRSEFERLSQSSPGLYRPILAGREI
jgi:predicted nucleotidyltransferase